jgi:hypothetical protein
MIKEKEVTTMMNINNETFWKIADLLIEVDSNGMCKYSIDKIAEMTNVSIDVVEYIDLVENVPL